MRLQVSVGQWNLEPLLHQAKFARRTQKKPLPTEKKATGSVAVGLLNSRGWGIGLERQFSPVVNGLPLGPVHSLPFKPWMAKYSVCCSRQLFSTGVVYSAYIL